MPSAGPNGEYFGCELDFIHCEALMLAKIPPAQLEVELERMQTKWWDYRNLHPVKATYLFAHHYNLAYKAVVQMSRDVERGAHMKAWKGKDIFERKTELTGLWKARQNADALGMRYDFYCLQALKWAEDRNWKNLMRPTAMYSDDVTEFLQEAWMTECRARLQVAMHPRYQLVNNFGHVDQEAYRKWALGQVSARQHKEFALHTYMVSNAQLDPAEATEWFGADAVRRALEISLDD